jgi:hypothetical protein
MRLVMAGGFLLLVFFLNQLIFSSQKITSDDCAAGQCAAQELAAPQLTKDENIFYQDDMLVDLPSGYYRLTFQAKSDHAENVIVKLNTYTEKNQEIKKASLKQSEKFLNHEIFFFLPEGFDNLLFEKEEPGREGDIFLKAIGVTKLNVDTPEEFAALRETIVAETRTGSVGPAQVQASTDSFDLLHEPEMILGQTFKAEGDYISGVSLKMDIFRDRSVKDKNYNISLQEVRCGSGDCYAVGTDIAQKTFSTADALERYRQSDGAFLFPLYADVEKGRTYFVGIDNSSVEVSDRNYLDLKGGRNDDTYSEGSAAFRVRKNVFKIAGDLFFKIHGIDFEETDGMKIMNGARIESLGKGKGKYTYAAKGEFSDIFDLQTASPGTNFDDKRSVIAGKADADSALTYEINTIFPIQKIHFFAEQAQSSWKRVKVEYSFDQEKWIAAPFSESADQEGLMAETIDGQIGENEETEDENLAGEAASEAETQDGKDLLQKFDFAVVAPRDAKTIYFRITPDMTDISRTRYFSIKNLKIEADLIVK